MGIQTAIAAGMRSIGIGPIIRVGAADILLPNLIGVHLVDLQAQLKLAPENLSQTPENNNLKVTSSF